MIGKYPGKHDVGNLAHRDDGPGGGGGGRPKYAKAGQGQSSQSVRSSRSNMLSAGGGEIA